MGRGGFVESGQFNKPFSRNAIKKGTVGKNFGAFPPRNT